MSRPHSRFTLPALLLLLALLPLSAAPAPAEEPTLVVENARVLVGDGTVLERGAVLVSGDRIVEVTSDPVEAPGARRIDAGGGTVLPGLIDTHVHLLMEKLFEQPRTDEEMSRFLGERVPERLEAFTRTGITTVFSPGDYWPFAGEIRDRVRAGELPGPRYDTAGPLFTSPGGHPAATFCGDLDVGGDNPWCREHLTVEVASPQEARDAVARLAGEGADALKLVWGPAPGATVLDEAVVSPLIDAAHHHDLRAYGHILEPGMALAAIEKGLDALVHLPAADPEGEELERVVDAMEREEVPAATTLTIFDSMARMLAEQGDEEATATLEHLLAGMRRTLVHLAEEAPDLVALGTDSPHLAPADAYHREIELVHGAGLTPEQIIQAATRNAAAFLGLGDELGTLEPGKRADLLVVEGNPLADLADLREVAVVVQGGEVVVEE